MRNLLLAWIYILAMVNLVVWSAVYGNISHGTAKYSYQRVDSLNAYAKAKPQWI